MRTSRSDSVARLSHDAASVAPAPATQELRDEIISLLAEPPVRIEAHPYSAIPALPGDAD